MANIILPVSPEVARRVLSGDQHVIARRVLPARLHEGARITLYSDKKLLGKCTAMAVATPEDCNLWAVAAAACMELNDLLGYWYGARRPGYITIGSAYAFLKPRPWAGAPLQNFIYELD